MSSFSSIQVRIFVTINKKKRLMSFYFCYFLLFHVLMAIAQDAKKVSMPKQSIALSLEETFNFVKLVYTLHSQN
jgi:hypothetical protein